MIVQPGGTNEISKGYSSVTVLNNSDNIPVHYRTLIHCWNINSLKKEQKYAKKERVFRKKEQISAKID